MVVVVLGFRVKLHHGCHAGAFPLVVCISSCVKSLGVIVGRGGG